MPRLILIACLIATCTAAPSVSGVLLPAVMVASPPVENTVRRLDSFSRELSARTLLSRLTPPVGMSFSPGKGPRRALR